MGDEFVPAIATLQEDSERVRVTRWHFPPGSETGWHKHMHDYVVVPTIGGTLTIINPDQSRHPYEVTASESYFRRCGAEHNVVNLSGATVEFVEIELKQVTT